MNTFVCSSSTLFTCMIKVKVITIDLSTCVLVSSTLCCLGEGVVDVDEVVAEVRYVGADQLPLGIVL